MIKESKVSARKIKEVAFLKENIKKYNVIGLVSMEKIDARSIQKLRKALRGRVVMRMSKKRLMRRALEEAEKEFKNKKNISLLCNEIRGSSAMIFTDMNPLKLSKFLEDSATKGPAKAGDIAPEEIIVRAGNTQIAPGPIISELNAILKLPTMIKDGMIHIRNDTVTHKPGDPIDLKQAILLGRLGLEPMTIKLDFYSAWENGEIIPEEVLKLDEKKIIEDVKNAAARAFGLAMALSYLTDETIEPFILKAVREGNAMALELELITPDTIPIHLSRATAIASHINKMVLSDEEPSQDEDESKEEKKEEKDDDEVMGSGIGALFG